MNINTSKLLRSLLLASLALVSIPGWSAISPPPTSFVQPASIMIPLGQPAAMTVTWIVSTSQFGATISSSSGQFRIANLLVALHTVNTAVSAVAPLAGNSATVYITETVLVPPEISILATRSGLTQLVYERTFSDGTAGTAAISTGIQVGGSGAGPFSVSRIALAFDDGAVVRVVPDKSRLRAAAELTLAGSGFLKGEWEIADPGSTSGIPIFRQWQPVMQGAGGSEKVKLTSPDLPTDMPGLYMVRLNVTSPPPSFEPPVLYYYVGEPKAGTPLALMPMTVMNPPNHTYIEPTTQFAWQPVKGALVYKIEIFATPKESSIDLPDLGSNPVEEDPQLVRRALSHPPMAGMLVNAKQTQTTLSAATRSKLQQQHSFFWRVQAIGQDGTIIGEAHVRELRMP